MPRTILSYNVTEKPGEYEERVERTDWAVN